MLHTSKCLHIYSPRFPDQTNFLLRSPVPSDFRRCLLEEVVSHYLPEPIQPLHSAFSSRTHSPPSIYWHISKHDLHISGITQQTLSLPKVSAISLHVRLPMIPLDHEGQGNSTPYQPSNVIPSNLYRLSWFGCCPITPI